MRDIALLILVLASFIYVGSTYASETNLAGRKVVAIDLR
jgi:hypothetical protein